MIKRRPRVGIFQDVPDSIKADLSREFDCEIIQSGNLCRSSFDAVATTWSRGFRADDVGRHLDVKLVAVYGTGLEFVDADAVEAENIEIRTTSLDGTDYVVAECAIALSLALMRRLRTADEFVRKGDWMRQSFPSNLSMYQRRVGVVGLGYIGSRIAELCSTLGAQVGYFAKAKKEKIRFNHFSCVDELAAFSEVLFVSCRGGAEMNHVVNRRTFEMLGEDGFFVNVAQSRFVHEGDLIHALRSRVIAGAGLDVFENEPAVNPEFLQLDNVILHPHSAWNTSDLVRRRSDLMIENIRSFFLP